MLRKKGIVRKTFIFAAFLTTLVILCSFAILYFAMPGYYRYKREKTFEKNFNSLVADLQNSGTQGECAEIISSFCKNNNANVFSFDGNGTMLPTLSDPFISMKGSDRAFFTFDQSSVSESTSAYFSLNPEEEGGSGQTYTIVVQQRGVTAPTDETADGESPKVAIRSFSGKRDNVISMRGEVGAPVIGHIVASGTLQPVDEAKDVILSLMPYVLAVGVVLGLLLSWIYARQISKPILRISEAAVKMRDMEPDADSNIRSDDELGLLSRNLDALYGSLRENIDDLKREMEKANRLERSKTEMMQSASHELKTPISALTGMVEGMIDNVGAYRDKEKYLAECKGQIGKLSLLVDEILSASRADLSGDKLELTEVSVGELVESALEEYAVPLSVNGLKLQLSLEPIMITTDKAVLYRAISNLVSNATRYTEPHGEVRINLRAAGDTGRLTIENRSGPIPEDDLKRLFEPFFTRSYSRDRETSGTGLGLYIVKRSLERLGISCNAENGELGLRMTLEL